ncbi:hypothetical protein NDU88_003369 [Pleurodeles waltl]|uniref:Uncharacterized protein n=1 Tax=Pleurodeles waltl TaxID=8319 RepID=A0AAV7TND6_PLEWA|nr:hypothetical protein NDU88_003369 [Pleurodeles waltl]
MWTNAQVSHVEEGAAGVCALKRTPSRRSRQSRERESRAIAMQSRARQPKKQKAAKNPHLAEKAPQQHAAWQSPQESKEDTIIVRSKFHRIVKGGFEVSGDACENQAPCRQC